MKKTHVNTHRLSLIIMVLLFVCSQSLYAAPQNPVPASTNLPAKPISVTSDELKSLGCLVGGSSIAGATILLSGASMFFLGGQGVATVGVIATPVLAAAIFTGCSFGSQIAPGLTWLYKNNYIEPW